MAVTKPWNRYRLSAAIAAGGVVIMASSALALTQAKPSAPNGATRVRDFAVNLDGARGNERILVFNLDQSGQPTTYVSVWHRRAVGRWDQTQYSRVFGPSPGSRASGLEYSIVGDLNRDNRYEIAVLDYVTPSAGEILTILRQNRYHGLRFRPLQTIAGDKIATAPPAPGGQVAFTVTIKANHSPDGRVHNERWAWSKPKGLWVCVSGPSVCVPR